MSDITDSDEIYFCADCANYKRCKYKEPQLCNKYGNPGSPSYNIDDDATNTLEDYDTYF